MFFNSFRKSFVALALFSISGNIFAAQNNYRPKKSFAQTNNARRVVSKKLLSKNSRMKARSGNPANKKIFLMNSKTLFVLMALCVMGAHTAQATHEINMHTSQIQPMHHSRQSSEQLTVYCSQCDHWNKVIQEACQMNGICSIKAPESLLLNNAPQTPFIPQIVSFKTEQNNTIICSLEADLSLTCSNPKTNHRVLFNLLDNNDPLNNCCIVDNGENVKCSIELCDDPRATQGPCSKHGSLVNVKRSETYDEKHYEITKRLENIYIEAFHNFRYDIGTEDNPFKELTDEIDRITNNLNILPCNKITKILIKSDGMDNGETSGRFIKNCQITGSTPYAQLYIQSDTPYILLTKTLKRIPLVYWLVGHEITHDYQFQTEIQFNPALKFRDYLQGYSHELLNIRPSAEMSADILGALASDYTKLAVVGYQWITYEHDGLMLCTVSLPRIDRSNADSIQNLIKPNEKGDDHPDPIMRGTILLKLSTMIKAAVKYLDRKEK